MIVFYIVVAVLVLLFGIFSYLNAATWNVLHVLMLFFTFAAGFGAMVLLAAVVKTQTGWQEKAESLQASAEQLEASVEMLRSGIAINQSTGAVLKADPASYLGGVEAELKRELLGRGRVWRNVTPGSLANNEITLTLPPVNAPPIQGATLNRSFAQNDLIYAFGQKQLSNNFVVPAYYIGEFVVKQVNPDRIVVAPTTKLDPIQQRLIGQGGRWTLYDTMPVDEHETWQTLSPQITEKLLREAAQPLQLAPPEIDQVVGQYQRSGKPAQADDPERAVFNRAVFQKEYEVDVDAQADSGIIQDFEPGTGLASSARLKQGAPTKFSPGDKVLIPTSSQLGKALVQQGVVTIEGKVYQRPLIDFAYEEHAYKAAVDDKLDRNFVLKESIQMLQESEGIAKDVIVYREQEKSKLEQDKSKIEYEQEQITKYKDRLTDYIAETLQLNSRLYRTNVTLAEELERIHMSIKAKIDRESLEAADQSRLTLAN